MATTKKGYQGFYVVILKNKDISKHEYGLHPMHVGRFYSVHEELKRLASLDEARKYIQKRTLDIEKAGFKVTDAKIKHYTKQVYN